MSMTRPESHELPSVAAVVVTHNRLALLQECIAALVSQSHPLQEIIVVDNGSTDGTSDWLAAYDGLTVICQSNQGSAGGQCAGMKAAVAAGHEWVWCMDDDTIPQKEALERFLSNRHATDPGTGFLCSVVLWTDGSIHLMNAPGIAHSASWMAGTLEDRAIRVESCSFVSLLVRSEAIRCVGLPIAAMFIWLDDAEFTRRLSLRYGGWLVLDSVVCHKTAANADWVIDKVTPANRAKYLYEVRNRLLMIRRYESRTRRRWYLTCHHVIRHSLKALLGQAPLVTFVWLAKGLVFNPSVEFVGQRSLTESVRSINSLA